jgi:Tfp pilus assembly protein PilX
MLTASTPPRAQHGIVLFITLIVLVAMTLAGIALVRSVSTTNLIAGNLAFQQGAVFAGDTGIENAIAWLDQNNTGTTLHADNSGTGYSASRQDPTSGQSWDDFWNNQLAAQAFPATPVADAAGNSVQYVIQRLCASAGDPSAVGVNCATSPSTDASAGSSKSAGGPSYSRSSSVYYRITSRIAGPRNTVSYVQAIVSL